MKIIAKRGQKDYYDYLQGIYGVDPKIILDRREFTKYMRTDRNLIRIFLCGWVYEGWFENDRFYWGEELLEVGEEEKYSRWRIFRSDIRCVNIPALPIERRGITVCIEPYEDELKFNEKQNCPILIQLATLIKGHDFGKYPILKEIDFHRVLSPQDIYLKLSEWLAPKDQVEDKLTDKQKIVSKGFDLKTSFRKTK